MLNYHLHVICISLILFLNTMRLVPKEDEKVDKVFDIVTIVYSIMMLGVYAAHWYFVGE